MLLEMFFCFENGVFVSLVVALRTRTSTIVPIEDRSPVKAIPLHNAFLDKTELDYDRLSIHTVT